MSDYEYVQAMIENCQRKITRFYEKRKLYGNGSIAERRIQEKFDNSILHEEIHIQRLELDLLGMSI